VDARVKRVLHCLEEVGVPLGELVEALATEPDRLRGVRDRRTCAKGVEEAFGGLVVERPAALLNRAQDDSPEARIARPGPARPCKTRTFGAVGITEVCTVGRIRSFRYVDRSRSAT